jgi:hypothetical protein
MDIPLRGQRQDSDRFLRVHRDLKWPRWNLLRLRNPAWREVVNVDESNKDNRPFVTTSGRTSSGWTAPDVTISCWCSARSLSGLGKVHLPEG